MCQGHTDNCGTPLWNFLSFLLGPWTPHPQPPLGMWAGLPTAFIWKASSQLHRLRSMLNIPSGSPSNALATCVSFSRDGAKQVATQAVNSQAAVRQALPLAPVAVLQRLYVCGARSGLRLTLSNQGSWVHLHS